MDCITSLRKKSMEKKNRSSPKRGKWNACAFLFGLLQDFFQSERSEDFNVNDILDDLRLKDALNRTDVELIISGGNPSTFSSYKRRLLDHLNTLNSEDVNRKVIEAIQKFIHDDDADHPFFQPRIEDFYQSWARIEKSIDLFAQENPEHFAKIIKNLEKQKILKQDIHATSSGNNQPNIAAVGPSNVDDFLNQIKAMSSESMLECVLKCIIEIDHAFGSHIMQLFNSGFNLSFRVPTSLMSSQSFGSFNDYKPTLPVSKTFPGHLYLNPCSEPHSSSEPQVPTRTMNARPRFYTYADTQSNQSHTVMLHNLQQLPPKSPNSSQGGRTDKCPIVRNPFCIITLIFTAIAFALVLMYAICVATNMCNSSKILLSPGYHHHTTMEPQEPSEGNNGDSETTEPITPTEPTTSFSTSSTAIPPGTNTQTDNPAILTQTISEIGIHKEALFYGSVINNMETLKCNREAFDRLFPHHENVVQIESRQKFCHWEGHGTAASLPRCCCYCFLSILTSAKYAVDIQLAFYDPDLVTYYFQFKLMKRSRKTDIFLRKCSATRNGNKDYKFILRCQHEVDLQRNDKLFIVMPDSSLIVVGEQLTKMKLRSI